MTTTEKSLLVAEIRIAPKCSDCHGPVDKGDDKISTTSTKNIHHKLSELQMLEPDITLIELLMESN